jgi:hypothetical protein
MLTPIPVTAKCTDEDLPGTSLQAGYLLHKTISLSPRTVPAVYFPCLIVDPQNQLKHG